MTTITPEMITEADREAAWPYRPSCYKDAGAYHNWREGVYDGIPIIRAMAAHRLSGKLEAEREIVAWLRDDPIEFGYQDAPDYIVSYKVADAIESRANQEQGAS